MSLFRSILNSASPPRGYAQAYSKPHKHDRELELPLHNSPPPSIPSPITKSTYRQPHDVVNDLHASTLRLQQEQQKSDDVLLLQRREEYLQRRLQELLDAQADGLLSGLSDEQGDGVALRSGSSTPTASALRTPSISTSSRRAKGGLRSPSPAPRKSGLKQARREIYRTIRQLSSLKAAEDEHLGASQEDDESVLQQIDIWERRRTRLEREMKETEGQEGGEEIVDLQTQADKMSGEIQEMEIRLAQMKTRHRQLLAEIEEVDNNVQSKLASYKSSLSMLDKEVRSFLDRPQHNRDQSTFGRLPPSRRTLDIAKEHFQDRLNHTERLRRSGQVERDALDQGAKVWKEVVESLGAFETKLETEMASVSQERDKDTLSAKTRDIVQQMNLVLSDLEAKLDFAREKQWHLLVCCIGAEAEAFKQGKEILEDLLPGPENQTNGAHPDPTPSSSRQLSTRGSPAKRGRIASPPTQATATSESDDDPDPELLITHQQDQHE